MNRYPQTVTLFSRDTELCARLKPLLGELMALQICSSYYEFGRLMDRCGPGVVLLDVRLPPDAPELDVMQEEFPDHLFLVMGAAGSHPMRHPAISRMYGTLDLRESPQEVARQVETAQRFLDLQQENRQLLREVETFRARPNPEPLAGVQSKMFSVRELIRIMRSLDNVEVLQERLLEELSGVMHLSRAGIALRRFRENAYAVCAGWMLSPESRNCAFEASDAFIRWFENHPRLITRPGIQQLKHPAEEMMLNRVLDRLGAEVILPLRGKNGLIGWFFSSHPLNGLPFTDEALDQLILIADLMAVSLERALLYQEVSLQKTLAETLINALPLGIIYADASGIIRWCSPVTQLILGGNHPDKTGESLQSLGPKLCEAVNALRLKNGKESVIREWRDPANGRPLRATAIGIQKMGTAS